MVERIYKDTYISALEGDSVAIKGLIENGENPNSLFINVLMYTGITSFNICEPFCSELSKKWREEFQAAKINTLNTILSNYDVDICEIYKKTSKLPLNLQEILDHSLLLKQKTGCDVNHQTSVLLGKENKAFNHEEGLYFNDMLDV